VSKNAVSLALKGGGSYTDGVYAASLEAGFAFSSSDSLGIRSEASFQASLGSTAFNPIQLANQLRRVAPARGFRGQTRFGIITGIVWSTRYAYASGKENSYTITGAAEGKVVSPQVAGKLSFAFSKFSKNAIAVEIDSTSAVYTAVHIMVDVKPRPQLLALSVEGGEEKEQRGEEENEPDDAFVSLCTPDPTTQIFPIPQITESGKRSATAEEAEAGSKKQKTSDNEE